MIRVLTTLPLIPSRDKMAIKHIYTLYVLNMSYMQDVCNLLNKP